MKKFNLLPILLIFVLASSCEEKVVEGTNSLIEILEEPPGENCINGGSKVITGIDINN